VQAGSLILMVGEDAGDVHQSAQKARRALRREDRAIPECPTAVWSGLTSHATTSLQANMEIQRLPQFARPAVFRAGAVALGLRP